MAAPSAGLFQWLKASAAAHWRAYTEHEFVRQIAEGSLPAASFRHYLGQDYLFLIHFARAYALAAYKADNLADMRAAARAFSAIVDHEMTLHVDYCAGWGLTEADMEALPEASATMAYTRYVLETGVKGDILDLYVALAPCVIGYGEIGRRLIDDAETRVDGNPYYPWIEMYGGADYQTVTGEAIAQLDRLADGRVGERRLPALAKIFGEATRLETRFWEMALTLAD